MTFRCLWLTVALLAPACGFTAPGSGDDGVDPVDPADPGAPTVPTARWCPTSDSHLKLCVDFDDQVGLTGDGSSRHHTVVSSGLTVMDREGEQAALMSDASQLTVAETTDLDITSALTVAMFVRPAHVPAFGQAFWALDNNKQYAISYQDTTKFRCGLGTKTVDSALWFAPDHWHHVACTFDLSTEMLKIYVDGYVAGCRQVSNPIATDGHEGLAIGANVNAGPSFTEKFVGGIDNVAVFDRTLTSAELCTAAGGGPCTSACPFIAD